MPLMVWKEEYETGVKLFDDQHKNLVNMLNNLLDAMKAGKGKDVLDKVLTGLIEYTVYHFKAEEDNFKKYAYAQALTDFHKKEHDNLTQQVVDFKKRFDGGEMISIELMNFLKDWLINHILVTDKKYGPYLNSKGLK